MIPFVPLVRNTHAQTILGAFWPRPEGLARFPVSARYARTEPHVQVLVHSQEPSGTRRGVLLLVHGLEGSSDAGYMRSAAHAALRAGYAVHRLNLRSCGGTEHLCDTLYHAGLTVDAGVVVRELAAAYGHPIAVAGFSLGANIVLKLAGELGREARDVLAGVAAVSTPLDLRECAIALNHPRCRLYQDRFVRNMSARLRRRHALRPDLFSVDRLDGIRSVYEFDDRITAPAFGFGTADHYYGTQSSGLFLERIAIPALLVQAKDDPMIPFAVFAHPALVGNPHLSLLAVEHGGHVGFLARSGSRFWVDAVLCEWLAGLGNKSRSALVSL